MTSLANITQSDIKKLAALSRMELSEEESLQYAKEIDSILAYVHQIQEVTETANFPGQMSPHMVPRRNMLREDIVEPLETKQEDLVHLAPESQDGYIKVKKILN